MLNLIKLIWLRRKARRIALSIHAQLDSMPCGVHMALQLRPGLLSRAERFDTIMDRIREIDPKAPAGSLAMQLKSAQQ